jgi:hypothetical protein
MLFTFSSRDHESALQIVRTAAWLLAEKYSGCTAEVVAHSRDGNEVTVDLRIGASVASLECFEWFTQLLADRAMVLVRDHYFEWAMRQIGTADSKRGIAP